MAALSNPTAAAGGGVCMPEVMAGPAAHGGLPESFPWGAVDPWHLLGELDRQGHALIPGLLDADQCRSLSRLYDRADLFRSRIVMARHGFGRGEYQYFARPLPPLLDALRHALYEPLAPLADRWNERLGLPTRYPPRLDDFLARCHDAGQCRPTPLLLRYGPGDYNCLHQDLYGEQVFPLQVAVLLAEPDEDFTGGEFVMTQTGRGGQEARVIPLRRGDAVVFAVNERPVPGRGGGWRRVAMRHGVSRVRTGLRHTVGLIFHDAR